MTIRKQDGTDPEPVDRDSDVTTALVRRARAGDRAGLERLVRRLTPLLLSAARYETERSSAGAWEPIDLVHETWLRTLPRISELEPRSGRVTPVLLRFLSTTMWRVARDERRRKSPHELVPEAADSVEAASQAGVFRRILAEEERGLVTRAIADMSPADREVLILRGIEGHPTAEVARRVDSTPGAVRERYRRAVGRLRELLPDSVFSELS